MESELHKLKELTQRLIEKDVQALRYSIDNLTVLKSLTDDLIVASKLVLETKFLLDVVFDHCTDLLVIVDRTVYIRVSNSWKTQLGWEKQEIIAMQWAPLLHPDDVPLSQARAKARLDGTPVPANSSVRLRHKDGSYKKYLFTNIVDGSGTKLLAVGVSCG